MEKNIHKFITHVVNNLFPLNEYSDAEMSGYLLKNEPEYIYNELLSDSIK